MNKKRLRLLLIPVSAVLLVCCILFFCIYKSNEYAATTQKGKHAMHAFEVQETSWSGEKSKQIGFVQSVIDSSSDDLEVIVESYFIPELNITYLVLKNGMRVCLKPTDFECDEIMIKLAAKGGYGALSTEDRPSGELAAQIAWESGMGGLTSDQVSVFLYEHSLDLSVKIKAFSREIEGIAAATGLEAFLDAMKVVFMHQHFTQEGKEIALKAAENAIKKESSDYEQAYEAFFTQVNAPQVSALRPLAFDDLKYVDLGRAQKFFQESFANPADFMCVIVGSFDLADARELVTHILGSIPNRIVSSLYSQQQPAAFPPGVTNKVIDLQGRSDCLTRITFPLQMEVNEKTIHLVEFLCQIMEARIRTVLTAKMQYSYGVDVSYEFPLYPYLVDPWVSIRYRSADIYVNTLKHLILSELGLLQTSGASEEEIAAIKRLQSGSQDYWFQDNFYWMSVLSNYCLWDWNPAQIVNGEHEVSELPAPFINAALKNFLILGNYSVVTAKP